MKIARPLGLVVALALLATACTGTHTVTESPSSSEEGVDPNWHLTGAELAALAEAEGSSDSGATTVSSVQNESGSVKLDEELNDGAAFDQFVIDRFPAAGPSQLGALQVVISGHCTGLVDKDTIGLLTTDPDIQRAILDISDSECTSLATSALVLPSSPVDAETWDEAVRRRFARTVSWHDEAAFAEKAERACATGESAFALSSDQNLSTSVVVELAAFTAHGDCLLLDNTDGQAVRTTTASENDIVVESVDLETTLYFLRASDEENIGDRKRDLYSLSVATGEVTRLTVDQKVRSVALSPDGTMLAYAVEGEVADDSVVYAGGAASDDAKVVGVIAFTSGVLWTPDNTGILHSVEDDEGNRAIARLDISNGSSAVVIEPGLGNVWSLGFAGEDLLHTTSDGRDTYLVRNDADGNEDSLLIPYGNSGLAPDGSQLIVSERGTGELWRIDLEADVMASTSVASGPGLEAWPAISPDSRYVAYGVGPEFRANQIFLTDLTAPETRVNLTGGLDATEVGKVVWAPDSQSLFFNAGEFDFESMYYVTIDGVMTDLGEVGRPLLAARIAR